MNSQLSAIVANRMRTRVGCAQVKVRSLKCFRNAESRCFNDCVFLTTDSRDLCRFVTLK
jgi:hypothetical protein